MIRRSQSQLIAGFSCALVVGLALVPEQRALGQASAAGALEEIVVTARRREESLMETPVSITAFTNAELAARQMDQISQIAEATPGLVFRRQAGPSQAGATIFIRGVGQEDRVPTKQPGVAMYMDGVYIAQMSGALIELIDIETVEVLRGPQGTLFGRNSIGGAIQVNTVKPSNEFDADIEFLAGEYSRQRIKGSVNIPFSDTFFGKFSASVQEKQGYIYTPLIPDDDGKGGDDNTSARVALRWVPSDALTIDLAADYSKHESFGPPTVIGSPINESVGGPMVASVAYNTVTAPALGLPLYLNQDYFLPADQYTSLQRVTDPSTSAVSHPSIVGFDHLDQESTWESLSLTVTWDISDNLSFKSITNHRTLESDSPIDSDESPLDVFDVGEIYDGDQSSQEFQLSGIAFDGRMDWVAGVYYFEEEVLNLNPVDFPLFHLVSGSFVDNSSTAVFGQFTYDFSDKWSLTLGVRNTDEELDSIVNDLNQHIVGLFNPAVPGGYVGIPPPPDPMAIRITPNTVRSSDTSETEPYVNLAYNFTDTLMGYVSYSEGFKGGGFTQRLTPGRLVDAFGPEFAEVIEVGAKWAGDRVRVSGSLFRNDYKSLQVATNRQLGGSTENAADAEITGGELEVTAAVTDRFQVSLGLGYLDGEYENLDPAVQFSASNRLPNVMDWQRSAAASYRFSLGPGELIARLDYFHMDDYFTEADNLPELFRPSYDIYNGSLTYIHSSDKWEVSIQGRNIADEFYTISGRLAPASQGWTQAVVGPPAEWSGRFAYRF